MNKVVLVMLVASILLGVGAAMLLRSNKNPAGYTANSPSPALENSTTSNSSARSMNDLLAERMPQECTFKDEGGNEVLVQIGDNRLHGEFLTKISDYQTRLSHLYVENKIAYAWVEGEKIGMKMDFAKINAPQASGRSTDVDINNKIAFDCRPWVIDPEVFHIDDAVEYKDLNVVVLPSLPANASPGVDSANCSACDNLPDDAKVPCLQVMGC